MRGAGKWELKLIKSNTQSGNEFNIVINCCLLSVHCPVRWCRFDGLEKVEGEGHVAGDSNVCTENVGKWLVFVHGTLWVINIKTTSNWNCIPRALEITKVCQTSSCTSHHPFLECHQISLFRFLSLSLRLLFSNRNFSDVYFFPRVLFVAQNQKDYKREKEMRVKGSKIKCFTHIYFACNFSQNQLPSRGGLTLLFSHLCN